ncbi:hypothetical protein HMI56_001289 [Coelomomyces lativittatus]|nr:hypothetical protein HMI56_001289 [Coelomomyces lativittatus]
MTSIPISSSFIGLRKTSLTGIKNIGDSFFYFLLIFSLCCTLTIRAQTYVSRTGSDNVSCGSSSTPCSTLQYAIDKTPNQGSILVMPGTYSGHGNRGITFPGKTVNITSVGGPNVTILDAMGADRHFLFVAQEAGWIDGFTIINGMATSGGCALYTMASLSFKNSVFRNCTAKTVDGSTVISAGSLLLLLSVRLQAIPLFHLGAQLYLKEQVIHDSTIVLGEIVFRITVVPLTQAQLVPLNFMVAYLKIVKVKPAVLFITITPTASRYMTQFFEDARLQLMEVL